MNTWAIIPVKSLQLTKSRLTAVLSAQERANLTKQLLLRLLIILNEQSAISEVVVVSRDETVQALARPLQAITIAEPTTAGLNEAIHSGARLAFMGRAERILVLPSDLPRLTLAEVDLVCDTAVTTPSSLTICPDRHEKGTNALLLPADRDFQFQFGRNSFSQHQQEAKRCGLRTTIIRSPGWQFDLDTAEDWEIYQKELSPQASHCQL
jgi:2-phospho-L-lactate guanylyltransferase